MRKRNHTVTIRMNKAEYDLLQSKVKESGRTQQEVVIKAIADLKIEMCIRDRISMLPALVEAMHPSLALPFPRLSLPVQPPSLWNGESPAEKIPTSMAKN